MSSESELCGFSLVRLADEWLKVLPLSPVSSVGCFLLYDKVWELRLAPLRTLYSGTLQPVTAPFVGILDIHLK